ncbi:response regulator [Candidatus Saccharibacteria bacterium]|nr:response regulator [Candidatus Saccharibacteria bacterium]
MQKIAIIEDDSVIAEMYRMKFELEGFDVEVASDGRLGVQMVEEISPDLILMDLQMPEMGGAEALGIIRAQEWGRDVPVLILTNTGEEEAPDSLHELRVESYIVKAELTPSKVVERAKEVLAKYKK